jgi:hypothetical protein
MTSTNKITLANEPKEMAMLSMKPIMSADTCLGLRLL